MLVELEVELVENCWPSGKTFDALKAPLADLGVQITGKPGDRYALVMFYFEVETSVDNVSHLTVDVQQMYIESTTGVQVEVTNTDAWLDYGCDPITAATHSAVMRGFLQSSNTHFKSLLREELGG